MSNLGTLKNSPFFQCAADVDGDGLRKAADLPVGSSAPVQVDLRTEAADQLLPHHRFKQHPFDDVRNLA